jgi:hypothetical protein
LSSLDNLRKAAKRWLKALRDGDADARARLVRAYPSAPEPPTLRDVQHALARERGHESWVALKMAIADRVEPETPLIALLRAAGRATRRGSPRSSMSTRTSSTNAERCQLIRDFERRCTSASATKRL